MPFRKSIVIGWAPVFLASLGTFGKQNKTSVSLWRQHLLTLRKTTYNVMIILNYFSKKKSFKGG